jgi:hypothetical protein
MNHLIELGRRAAETHEFEKKPDSWWAKQKGAARASTEGSAFRGGKVMGLRNSKMMVEGLKGQAKGAGAGAAIGGVAGALLAVRRKRPIRSLRTGAGAAAGAILGQHVGQYKADQKYLRKKGVKVSRAGLKTEFTPSARKRYVRD